MDLGFDGASMARSPAPPASPRARSTSISPTRTGCSRRSSSRKSLEQGKIAFNFDPERDVDTTLREFGRAYIQLLCRPGGGSAIRTVMAIAERMPEVGRRYLRQRAGATDQPPCVLSPGAGQASDLAIDDCELAASQFMQMCQATLFLAFIFQAAPPPPASRLQLSWKAPRGCFCRRIG